MLGASEHARLYLHNFMQNVLYMAIFLNNLHVLKKLYMRRACSQKIITCIAQVSSNRMNGIFLIINVIALNKDEIN